MSDTFAVDLNGVVAVVTGASRGAGRAIAVILGEAGARVFVHTLAWSFAAFLGNVLYDTAKAATARLAFGTAEQRRPLNVAVVAIAPGHLGVTESPEYLGRAIATWRPPSHNRRPGVCSGASVRRHSSLASAARRATCRQRKARSASDVPALYPLQGERRTP